MGVLDGVHIPRGKRSRVTTGHGNSCKVMEYWKAIFQAWKVMENDAMFNGILQQHSAIPEWLNL